MRDDSAEQNLDVLWEQIQQRLRAAVPESTFKIWLEPLRAVGAQGTTLFVAAPDGIKTWVERRYTSLLRDALAGAPTPLTEVAFSAPASHERGADRATAAELNPNYTFERFVIGEGNRAAHAAALAVAEAPSEAYNPLFLHGPPGLGKTHLLGAIANYLRANAPALSVRYTTAEGFTNEFVGALRSSGAEQFKSRYRDLDVLLVDDVQFLQGKERTEEEFFHTFNALYEGGSQLILSADRLPSELSTLASRLRDRFEWGLSIPVEPPDLPTRLTVLQHLAREAGLERSDDDALSELARRIDANIRRLHGALTKVIAHASLTAKPLSPELIAELIPSRTQPNGPTTVEEIQRRVAAAFGISRAELVGASRAAGPLRARQIAILLTREATDLSLPQIGRLYGGRDHSTVINSLRRVEATLTGDAELAQQVAELRASIHSPPTEFGLTADGAVRINAFHRYVHRSKTPLPCRFSMAPELSTSTNSTQEDTSHLKLTIKRDELVSKLSVISRAVSTRAATQALSGILLSVSEDGVALAATDGEVGLRTEMEADASGTGAALLPGRLLSEVARSLGDSSVEVELRESERDVEIRSGGSSFHLRVLPAEDFPNLPEEGSEPLKIPAPALAETIELVARAASRDDMRPVLTGVLVSATGEEMTMVATDSYRLAVKRTALESGIGGELEANIPAKALRELGRIVAAGGVEEVAVSLLPNQAVFRAGSILLNTRLIDGQFPNFRQLLPESYEHDVRLPRPEFLDVVRRVSQLAQRNAPLRLSFAQGELKVSASTPDVGDAEETMPAAFEGEPLEIGFNPEFLRDGIESVEGDEVVLRLISPLRPGLLQPVDSEDFRYLVMPIRLNV